VIGHELSHHFDDQGSQYDEHGALAEWWTPQDRERFNALTAQLVAEYDAYDAGRLHPGEQRPLRRGGWGGLRRDRQRETKQQSAEHDRPPAPDRAGA
jgi:hypothetical protein